MKKLFTIIFLMFSFTSVIFGKEKIRIVTSYESFLEFISYFKENNPDFPYDIEIKYISDIDNDFDNYLRKSLLLQNEDAPDIYIINTQLLPFIKDECSNYVMPYKKLGIDLDTKLQELEISPNFAIKNNAGEVIGIPMESTQGLFFYRRSIAKKTFGTDDPKEIQKIIGGNSGSRKDFYSAAEKLSENGYKIVFSLNDLIYLYEFSDKPFLKDNKIYVGNLLPFFDDAKRMVEKGSINPDDATWTSEWLYSIMYFSEYQNNNTNYSNYYNDEDYYSEDYYEEDYYEEDYYDEYYYGNEYYDEEYYNYYYKKQIPVFGYLLPYWGIYLFLSYDMNDDFAVCNSPVSFSTSGFCPIVNNNIKKSKKNAVKQLIEAITFDTSKKGYQSFYYLDKEYNKIGYSRGIPISNVILKKLNYKINFLQNENIKPYLLNSNNSILPYSIYDISYRFDDERIEVILLGCVKSYAKGEVSKKEAIDNFIKEVESIYGYKVVK